MIVKLLTEHHLEFLSLRGGCRGSSESTLVKLLEISYVKHIAAHMLYTYTLFSCVAALCFHFLQSILFVSDISLEQASALMTKCVNEVCMAWVKLNRITGVLNK